VRVFDDGSGFYPLWFEFEPNLFWCGVNADTALDNRRSVPLSGVPEEMLVREYPEGKVIE
jgi:hypothetical protein